MDPDKRFQKGAVFKRSLEMASKPEPVTLSPVTPALLTSAQTAAGLAQSIAVEPHPSTIQMRLGVLGGFVIVAPLLIKIVKVST